LKAPDVLSLNQSLKYKHYLRCHVNSHPISYFTLNQVKNLTMLGNKSRASPYINDILIANKKIMTIIDNDVKDLLVSESKINKDYISYYQHTELKTSSYFNINQSNLVKKLEKYKISTLMDVINQYKKNDINEVLYEVYLAYNTIPKYIRNLLNQQKKTHISPVNLFPSKLNIWKHITNVKTSDIKKRLMTSNKEINIRTYLNNRHNIDMNSNDRNPFITINKVTKEVKLTDLNYKLLHNIYPTMYHLHKWGIKEDNKCIQCKVPDNLIHSIYECNIAKATWDNFKETTNELLNYEIGNLTYKNVLLGISNNSNYNYQDITYGIDTIMLLIKRKLILQREEKRIISTEEIRKIIFDQITLEKRFKLKKTDLKKRWGNNV
jgi:hypothetical protein